MPSCKEPIIGLTSYLSEVMDGTGLGTDELLVLVELLAP